MTSKKQGKLNTPDLTQSWLQILVLLILPLLKRSLKLEVSRAWFVSNQPYAKSK